MTLFNPFTGFKSLITTYYKHANVVTLTGIILVSTLHDVTEEYPADTNGVIILNNATGNILQRYAKVRDERYIIDLVIVYEDSETILQSVLSEIDRAMGESNDTPAVKEQYELSYDLTTNFSDGIVRALVTIDRKAVAIPA